ncbi:MAG: cysteine--tRNA ligase, partial [Candidatus Woesearchaeota archaeon]|nr:cysteine--tRNA ligase [Candidatus Woesearchaeota archaeon]
PGVRQQEWDSPWGIGFPGWHIECSAMSSKYLGEHFDIHTGGEDHIPIHHTNEIAQSEAATGKKFVNYWIHGAFLTFKGEKISKSKGDLYTIEELENLGFKALAYRYFTYTAHYRSPLDFTLDNLKNGQNSYERIKNIISELKDDKKINEKYLKEFEKAINDDLDMPKAVSILWNLLRDKNAQGKIRTIKDMDKILSLDLLKKGIEHKIVLKDKLGTIDKITIKSNFEISEEVQELIKEREKTRKNKDWKKADELRNKIRELGWHIDDTNEGPKLKKI